MENCLVMLSVGNFRLTEKKMEKNVPLCVSTNYFVFMRSLTQGSA